MQIHKIPYLIKEDRGVILSAKRNATIVGALPEDETVYDDFETLAKRCAKHKLKHINQICVRTPDGAIDEAATEEAIQTNYADHYALLDSIAVDWVVGMKLTRKQPEPIRHNGKLYDVAQGHTVVDPNHTPAVVSALYVLIPAPAASGYPVWYQPAGSHDAWALGSRCEWPEGGQVWESTIAANTTEPGTLLPWGYWVKVIE